MLEKIKDGGKRRTFVELLLLTNGGIKLCSRNAFTKVIQEFAARDPLEMAELSGASFVKDRFLLEYCSLTVEITYPGGEINFPETGKNLKLSGLAHDEKVVILQYLTSDSGLPARGQWLSFLDLRGGQLHWRPFQKEALEPLARNYFNHREEFLALGLQHGGKLFEKGDAGIIVPVFPRLPLAFIIWEGGEEFAPRSQILFDTVSETYLSTAGLYVLAIQALIRVWFPGDTRFDDMPGEGL
ncbi:MAG: DUF3786 domain-containing protein [Dethiobacter sp.]|nr:MAG: DUF3786 domain-containing protein [Dethiobacter sp.]